MCRRKKPVFTINIFQEKANKLLLRCAQATIGTPLIVHNYSRLEDYFKFIWYR